jgi:hypothetical protein
MALCGPGCIYTSQRQQAHYRKKYYKLLYGFMWSWVHIHKPKTASLGAKYWSCSRFWLPNSKKKILRGLGIPGYRGNREIPTVYRENLNLNFEFKFSQNLKTQSKSFNSISPVTQWYRNMYALDTHQVASSNICSASFCLYKYVIFTFRTMFIY